MAPLCQNQPNVLTDTVKHIMYSTGQESKIHVTSGLMDHLTCLQTCN